MHCLAQIMTSPVWHTSWQYLTIWNHFYMLTLSTNAMLAASQCLWFSPVSGLFGAWLPLYAASLLSACFAVLVFRGGGWRFHTTNRRECLQHLQKIASFDLLYSIHLKSFYQEAAWCFSDVMVLLKRVILPSGLHSPHPLCYNILQVLVLGCIQCLKQPRVFGGAHSVSPSPVC